MEQSTNAQIIRVYCTYKCAKLVIMIGNARCVIYSYKSNKHPHYRFGRRTEVNHTEFRTLNALVQRVALQM